MSSALVHPEMNVGNQFLDYIELIKPRVVTLVILSVAAGFALAERGKIDSSLLALILLGTTLVSAGSMALNEYLERDVDAKMVRTQNRPLPSGRLKPWEALVFGILVSMLGLMVFAFSKNYLSGFVAFATSVIYLGIYTPLKTKTSLATVVGAVPGALPILIGWSGSSGSLPFESWILFLIVFFWQMPHFLAIAWMYRSDYERAGIRTLSVVDGQGMMLARQMTLYACALIPVSLLPTFFGMAGTRYFVCALLLGLFFVGVILYAATHLDKGARFVFRTSIGYLTVLFLFMIFN